MDTKPDIPNAFEEFPKIARLSRNCVVTEKIDGTNAQIYIAENAEPITLKAGRVVPFLCGSRSRWIFPEADNFGFANWAYDHVDELLQLGPGRHFGEWWGSGIQRGYGLTKGEKRFSLFNVARWSDERDRERFPNDRPSCCFVVPVLARAQFDTAIVSAVLRRLAAYGSEAAPGFRKPEGIVVWHEAARVLFKKTLDGDGAKGYR